jgi:hypothetical protein
MRRKKRLIVSCIIVAVMLGCVDFPTQSKCQGSCKKCGCPSGQTCAQTLGDPVPVCRTRHPGW